MNVVVRMSPNETCHQERMRSNTPRDLGMMFSSYLNVVVLPKRVASFARMSSAIALVKHEVSASVFSYDASMNRSK